MPLDQAEVIVGELVTDILNIAPLQSYFSDVYMAWPLLLAMVGVSVVVGVIYSVLIRYFASCMVWTMILMLMILLLAIGAVTALLPTTQFLKDIFHYDDLPETLQDRKFQIAVSIITLSLFLIGFLLICCMKRQIAICKHFLIQLSESSRQLPTSPEIAAGPSSYPSISLYSSYFSLLFG